MTSSIPGEGKTTTAVNLALAIAGSGQSVLLVDADLRKPKVADYMNLNGAVGLTDVLIDRVAPADAVQQWGTSGLYVLPAGAVPPNPSEMLGSRAMRAMRAMRGARRDRRPRERAATEALARAARRPS